MKVVKTHCSYDGVYYIVIQKKIENKTKYFEIKLKINNFKIDLVGVGVANNKNLNFKYVNDLCSSLRGLTGEERREKLLEKYLYLTDKETVNFAINWLYDNIVKTKY